MIQVVPCCGSVAVDPNFRFLILSLQRKTCSFSLKAFKGQMMIVTATKQLHLRGLSQQIQYLLLLINN